MSGRSVSLDSEYSQNLSPNVSLDLESSPFTEPPPHLAPPQHLAQPQQVPSSWREEAELWGSTRYEKFFKRAVAEWHNRPAGQARAMNSLYCLWGFKLRSDFDRPVYEQFWHWGLQDADAGCRYGLETLCRFYSYGLENRYDSQLWEHFQSVAMSDWRKGEMYGIEKLWAFVHFNPHIASGLPRQDGVEQVLSQFSCVEDFERRKASKPENAGYLGRKSAWGHSRAGRVEHGRRGSTGRKTLTGAQQKHWRGQQISSKR